MTLSDPLAPPDRPERRPREYAVNLAVEVSSWSPCRSKRGVVIFSDGDVISHGYNYKPRGFDCDGSDTCKATCRREAIHAEQQALMVAGNRAHASEMLHVKTVNGKLVPSGGPSCVECSKLARAAGIAWFWLYHDTGWRRYEMAEFHRLSLRDVAVPARAHQEEKDEMPDELARSGTTEIRDRQPAAVTDAGHRDDCAGTKHRCVSCQCPIGSPGLCGECSCEDDGAIW